jgi:hypothetical protein
MHNGMDRSCRIFQGRLCPKKGCFAAADDDTVELHHMCIWLMRMQPYVLAKKIQKNKNWIGTTSVSFQRSSGTSERKDLILKCCWS